MVIIGIIGRLGSGKTEFMDYLQDFFGIKVIKYPTPRYSEPETPLDENLAMNLTEGIIESWDQDIVIGPLFSEVLVKKLKKKNYFHLVFIEAEPLKRFENYTRKYKENAIDLVSFLRKDEEINRRFSLGEMRTMAGFEMENKEDLSWFFEEIKRKKEYIVRPIKPCWDQYFMNIAFSVRTRSNCMRKK